MRQEVMVLVGGWILECWVGLVHWIVLEALVPLVSVYSSVVCSCHVNTQFCFCRSCGALFLDHIDILLVLHRREKLIGIEQSNENCCCRSD
jgi:hypothetical protein